MCDIFLILNTTYFTGFADDNTPFAVEAFEEIEEILANWFSNNEVNLNTYKYHLLLNSQEPNTAFSAGNDTFLSENITEDRKRFITQSKHTIF